MKTLLSHATRTPLFYIAQGPQEHLVHYWFNRFLAAILKVLLQPNLLKYSHFYESVLKNVS